MDYVECLGLSADELPILLEVLRSAPAAADAINAHLEHSLLSLDTRRLALAASRQQLVAGSSAVGLTAQRRAYVLAASSTVSLVELGAPEMNRGLAVTVTEAELANLFRIGASARDQFCYAERLSQAFATDEGILLSLFLRYTFPLMNSAVNLPFYQHLSSILCTRISSQSFSMLALFLTEVLIGTASFSVSSFVHLLS